jgi:NADH-quinone oxidoreductase subunit J
MVKLFTTLYTLLLFTILSITVPSRVVSVVFLIGSYLMGVLVALIFGLEFVAMAILIVYMGAIAVFFLFIVMVLGGVAPIRPLTPNILLGLGGIFIFLCLAFSVLTVEGGVGVDPSLPLAGTAIAVVPPLATPLPVGLHLYTDYPLLFIGAGLLLLVAIVVVIGVVVMRSHSGNRILQEATDQRLRPYTIPQPAGKTSAINSEIRDEIKTGIKDGSSL